MLTDRDMELLLALRDARVAYDKALDTAIRDVTSDTLVARIAGVSRVTVWRWRKRRLAGDPVPGVAPAWLYGESDA